jgi:hypothetical protein
MTESDIISLGKFIYSAMDISPAQLGVTSRQINYWIDKKVTPFLEKQQEVPVSEKSTIKTTKWVRLNLAQAVWACIIKELLSFGIPIDDLAKLAENVWQKPREQKYADKVFQDHLNRKTNPLSEAGQQYIINSLKDEMHMEHFFRTVINPFTDMVKSAVIGERLPHAMVYVPEMIDYAFLMHDSELILKFGSVYIEHSIISIPIVPIISKVVAIDLYNQKKTLLYLSGIEREIRDIVVFKKPKNVVVAFENDQIKPITVTEDHMTQEELGRYILENKIAKGSKLLIDFRSQGNYKLTLMNK